MRHAQTKFLLVEQYYRPCSTSHSVWHFLRVDLFWVVFRLLPRNCCEGWSRKPGKWRENGPEATPSDYSTDCARARCYFGTILIIETYRNISKPHVWVWINKVHPYFDAGHHGKGMNNDEYDLWLVYWSLLPQHSSTKGWTELILLNYSIWFLFRLGHLGLQIPPYLRIYQGSGSFHPGLTRTARSKLHKLGHDWQWLGSRVSKIWKFFQPVPLRRVWSNNQSSRTHQGWLLNENSLCSKDFTKKHIGFKWI